MLSESRRTHIVTSMAANGSGVGGCWPTHDQILLRAAVLEDDEARDAWLRWRAANDPATTDAAPYGCCRRLRNLPADALDDGDATTLRSSYQATWYRNQLRLKSVPTRSSSCATRESRRWC